MAASLLFRRSDRMLFFLLVTSFTTRTLVTSQEQNPLTMNGGSCLAMAGDECVALAVDKRFASGNQMVNIAPRHVLTPSPQLMVAFTGLEGDVQSLSQDLSRQVSSKLGRGLGFMNEDRQQRPVISPRAMASLTSHVLYNRKRAPYYVEPLVVGLTEVHVPATCTSSTTVLLSKKEDEREPTEEGSRQEIEPRAMRYDEGSPRTIVKSDKNEKDYAKVIGTARNKNGRETTSYYRPYLCSMDMIGAKSLSDSFVCAGAASGSIFGTAEALWKPGLTREELVHVCARAFLGALERDCLSGYGAILYLITKDGVTEYDLATRSD